jgi:predicted secreted protein
MTHNWVLTITIYQGYGKPKKITYKLFQRGNIEPPSLIRHLDDGEPILKPAIAVSAVLLTTLVLLVGCVIYSSSAKIEISCDQFYDSHHLRSEVQLGIGDTATINLCSNPTTGFQWEDPVEITDSNILAQISHDSVAPIIPIPGQAGQEVWVFEALNKGVCTLIFKYSQPWEGGEKETWTYTLRVNVV